MLAIVRQALHGLPVSASIITSISLMLLCGFLMTRITKMAKLPNVTAYILTGILLGPACLNFIPTEMVGGMEFLADIALAFIAFSTGEFFKIDALKQNGSKVIVITLFEAGLSAIVVFAICFFGLHLNLAFALVLAALASATASASTVMTIRQLGAKGDYVDTLLQVIAVDNFISLVAYSVAISVAVAFISGRQMDGSSIYLPILKNIGVLLLGCLFGMMLKLFLFQKHSTDNRLIIAVAFLFSFCGICSVMDVSPLLGCMSMGTVYFNTTDDDKLFKQLNYFNPPILLLFFVRSGLSFDLNALTQSSGAVGETPLLIVGLCYFLFRIVGKYLGAFAGCACVGKSASVRNYLGLALIPQAGVAIGLAALGARSLGGETGKALNTIILASSILYELIGPPCAKLALHLSGSYSDKLEDLIAVPEVNEQGTEKTTVELLIERIQKIQKEMPNTGFNEDEQAFTDAAEELYTPQQHSRGTAYSAKLFRRS